MQAMSLLEWVASWFKPNRRRYDRRVVEYGVRLLVGGNGHECRMCDVSPSGALLVDAPNLPIGTMAVLEIPQVGLSADARIVRRTDRGIGIEFSKDGVGAIIAGWARGQSPMPDAPAE